MVTGKSVGADDINVLFGLLLKSIILIILLSVFFPFSAYAEKTDHELINSFMAQQYGHYDRSVNGWHRPDIDIEIPDYPGVWHICSVSPFNGGKEETFLLVACGQSLNGIHSSPGDEDIYLLKRSDNKIIEQTSLKNLGNGNWGRPGYFTSYKFGSNAYGVVETTDLANNGYQITYENFYLVIDNKVVHASWFASSIDDLEACRYDNRIPECNKLQTTWSINDKSTATVFDLNIHSRGQRNGKTVDQFFTIPFDPSQNIYTFPDELKPQF